MREILFRGKRKDNSEWVTGNLAAHDLICPGYPEDTVNATGKYYDEIPYVGFIEIDPYTVGQFTGMLDKNGKKIFEGDIVKVCGHLDYVIFEKGCFSMARQAYNYELTYQDSTTIEIIGNIHDNPDLLEE